MRKKDNCSKALCIVIALLALCAGHAFGACGDANSSGAVDIVDALIVAQYYVGLSPANIDLSASDANGDGSVGIVDALLIAQYYVGLLASLNGCTQATATPAATATVAPTAQPTGGPVIVAPPSWVNQTFYKKCVMVYGIPIKTSNEVPDQALFTAYYVIDAFLKKIMQVKPAIVDKMIANRASVSIVGYNECNSDLPEWGGTGCERRGGGGLCCTVLEEDCIVPASDTWRQNFAGLVHEFSHTTLSFGIGDAGNPGGADMALYNRILTAYNNAIAKNLYNESSYDRNNYHEYFCGQTCRWFNGNPTNLNVPNASSISDREQLRIYDPEIYQILSEYFGDYKLPAPWN